jgi:hypothetical protein
MVLEGHNIQKKISQRIDIDDLDKPIPDKHRDVIDKAYKDIKKRNKL